MTFWKPFSHLAAFQESLARERRLIWENAGGENNRNTEDAETNNIEGTFDREPDPVAEIQSKTRNSVLFPMLELERKELINKLKKSPIAIEEIIGSGLTHNKQQELAQTIFGEKANNASIEQIAFAVSTQKAYFKLFKNMANEALESPENIAVLIKSLESEAMNIEKIQEILEGKIGVTSNGSVILQRIKDLDEQIKKSPEVISGEADYYDFLGWAKSSSTTEDEIRNALSIHQIGKGNEEGKDKLLYRVWNLFKRDSKIKSKVAREFGPDEEKHGDTLASLKGSISQLKNHLFDVLKAKTEVVNKKFEERMQTYFEKYGTNDLGATAADLGISKEGLVQVITDAGILIKKARGRQIETNQFTQEAVDILTQLSELENEIELDDKKPDLGLFGRERIRHQRAMAWAADTARRLKLFFEKWKGNPDLLKRMQKVFGVDEEEALKMAITFQETRDLLLPFAEKPHAEIDPNTHDLLSMNYSDVSKQRNMTMCLVTLENESVADLIISGNETLESQEVPENLNKRAQLANTLRVRSEQLRNHLLPNGQLCEELSHEVSEGIGIKKRLDGIFQNIEKKCSAPVYESNELLRDSAATLEKIEKAINQIEEIKNNTKVNYVNSKEHQAIFDRIKGLNEAQGYYSHGNGEIFINTDRAISPEQQSHVLHHETGHAIIDKFVRKTSLFPDLLFKSYNMLMLQADETGESALQDLKALELKWKIPERDDDNEKKDLLMDELWVRYASWIHEGRKVPQNPDEYKKIEHKLFNLLEKQRSKDVQTAVPKELLSTSEKGMFMTDDLDADSLTPTSRGSSSEVEIINLNGKVQEIIQQANIAKRFTISYPSHPQNGEIKEWYERFMKELKEHIEDPYLRNNIDEEQGMSRLTQIKKDENFEEIIDSIIAFNKEQLLVDNVPNTGKTGLSAFFDGVTFLSIMDIVKAVKDGGEDLKRMWERSSQAKRNKVGELITSIIPDNNLWFLGAKYAGQLKHEYNKRGHSSELEEVTKWKDALKEIDPYELGDMVGNVTNKDQMRAILELLYEKGRLDWNNEDLWKKLIEMSGAPMPIEACRDDDLLRDEWLRRIITDIWDDKDKYNEWRRANDSNYNSEMEKFTEAADQLGNTNGLSTNLAQQLKIWIDAKGPPRRPVPNSVNPHKFEKILKYSIENGKMTMQDKFFYLVQGVRHGLISIDRLRVLAGEKGGVLMQFPFIDYFYGRNNSYGEIDAIGKRLEEKNNPYAPGSKTTLWLQLEVMRDENVRMRVSKAADRVLENIDHEDIPTLIGQLDYNQINGAADVVSGGRQKITREGWRNAYTGFGTKFKTFARIAEMGDEGIQLARFSSADAKNIAGTIASYIQMDNILTKNAKHKEGLPTLSWTEFEQSGPSTGGKATKVFRDSNNAFVNDLLEELKDKFNWIEFEKQTKISKEQYLFRIQGNTNSQDEEKVKEIYNSTGVFVDMLTKALIKNPEILKETLKKFANHTDEKLRLREEANEDDVTKDNTRKFFLSA